MKVGIRENEVVFNLRDGNEYRYFEEMLRTLKDIITAAVEAGREKGQGSGIGIPDDFFDMVKKIGYEEDKENFSIKMGTEDAKVLFSYGGDIISSIMESPDAEGARDILTEENKKYYIVARDISKNIFKNIIAAEKNE